MTNQVCNGAVITCPFATGPSSLVVTPESRVTAGGQPAANIMDNKPGANVMPFPMCASMANAAVATATSAACGVLTPQLCTFVPAGPLIPTAPTKMVGGQPSACQGASCFCSCGAGSVEIAVPGEFTVAVAA